MLALKPDMDKLLKVKGALMQVTAPGMEGYDCVSRSFAPKMGVPEDPVCGSGHCHIIPYWAQKLGRPGSWPGQASPRGGTLYCRMEGDRVILAGRAVLYARSELCWRTDHETENRAAAGGGPGPDRDAGRAAPPRRRRSPCPRAWTQRPS